MRHRRKPRATTLSRRRVLRTFGTGGVGLVLTACGATPRAGNPPADHGVDQLPDFTARFAGFTVADEPNGDLAKVVWPGFVTAAGPEVQQLYEFQITHGELMRWMPCFCGCGPSSGHLSNRDCYVQAVNPDGSVVLDAMAPT